MLQYLGPSVSLTWRDVAVLMMGWSDNAAANVLIDRLGMDAVNRRLDGLGLPRTPLAPADDGPRGRAPGRRERLHARRDAAADRRRSTPAPGCPPSAGATSALVAATTKRTEFRKPLPEAVAVLDKDGELEAVRAAAAVVDLPGRPYSVAIMTTYLRRDADGEALIREVSAALFETFDRLARSSDLGRIISER